MTRRRPRRRRLFVTGGSGFLGHHIVNGRAAEAWEVIAPSSASLDLRDRDSVVETIRDWRPTAIIHTAYRRGDRASTVDASRFVAEAAERIGARLVHVSTDALFRGRMAPYGEHDEPTPIHDYGRHKADAERIVAATQPQALIVRTSLIFGRVTLSPHERAVRDVISGAAATRFFVDEIRCPVLVEDLAAELTELAGRSEPQSILHLGGPDAFSRAELAVMTALRHGWDPAKLQFSTIAEAGLTRPDRVVLDSSLARSMGIAVRGPGDWTI